MGQRAPCASLAGAKVRQLAMNPFHPRSKGVSVGDDTGKEEHAFARRDIRIAAFVFPARGYATGSAGNLRCANTGRTAIFWRRPPVQFGISTRSGYPADPQGEWPAGDKNRLKEVRFHLALYRNNPCCKASWFICTAPSTALSRLARPGPVIFRPLSSSMW